MPCPVVHRVFGVGWLCIACVCDDTSPACHACLLPCGVFFVVLCPALPCLSPCPHAHAHADHHPARVNGGPAHAFLWPLFVPCSTVGQGQRRNPHALHHRECEQRSVPSAGGTSVLPRPSFWPFLVSHCGSAVGRCTSLDAPRPLLLGPHTECCLAREAALLLSLQLLMLSLLLLSSSRRGCCCRCC